MAASATREHRPVHVFEMMERLGIEPSSSVTPRSSLTRNGGPPLEVPKSRKLPFLARPCAGIDRFCSAILSRRRHLI